jgi:hypothetical protein
MITPSISTTDLYTHLDTLIETDTPVFIHGSPGIGKSYIVADIAEKEGYELVDVRLSQMDPVDLRGVPSIKGDQTVWMPPVFFPKETDSKGILFLDELNSAPPSVQAAIYQLVLNRKMGEYELPKNWRILCAGNRISDRGVVFRLPTPLANRMVHLHVQARFEDFKLFAIKRGLEIGKVTPIIYGTIGYSAGIEFTSYVKVYEELPDVAAIYEGHYPEIAMQPALLYALVSALVEYFNGSEAHKEHLFAFSETLPTEFGVMLVKDVIVKDESLATHSAFDTWLAKYGDYII